MPPRAFSEPGKRATQIISILLGLLPALLSQIGSAAARLHELVYHMPTIR